jgi:hypothetical protein
MGFHELFLKRNHYVLRGVLAYNSFQKQNNSLPEGYWVMEQKKNPENSREVLAVYLAECWSKAFLCTEHM